jgi:hypothetical protein
MTAGRRGGCAVASAILASLGSWIGCTDLLGVRDDRPLVLDEGGSEATAGGDGGSNLDSEAGDVTDAPSVDVPDDSAAGACLFGPTCPTTCPYRQQVFPGNQPPLGPGSTWVEAEFYDLGGEGVSYHDTTPCNVLGAFRTELNEGVDIEQACGDNCYDVAAIENGEWTEYTVEVSIAGDYAITLGESSPTTTRMHIEVDGADATGPLTSMPTTGFVGNDTGVAVHFTEGQHELRFVFDDGGLRLNWVQFTLEPDGGADASSDGASAESGSDDGAAADVAGGDGG